MNAAAASSASGEILIIDDTPDNLRFLSELLTRAGYTVRKMITGDRGLESALLEPPDLILLDIMMPGMTGYEVCARLKESDRTAHVPVIFLSGLDQEIEKVMAFKAGGVDYILKPFQAVEVLARIETHLKLNRLQTQLQLQNERLTQAADAQTSAAAALQILNQGLDARIKERTAELQAGLDRMLDLNAELQTALAQEQRLNAVQLQWIGTIAQKFRSSVSTITTALELLKRQGDRAETARYTHLIEDGAIQIRQTLQDLLLLNQAEPTKSLAPKSVDLTQFCRTLIEQWQLPEAPKYQLLFATWGKPAEAVAIDADLLQQAIGHLLTNAIRYSPNGGTILFELVYEPDQVVMRIRDEGIGIPAADRARIFDRFYRAENAALVSEASAGLGLTVVKQAIEQHGGMVAVSSELDRGSVFTMTLPLKSEAAASPKPETL